MVPFAGHSFTRFIPGEGKGFFALKYEIEGFQDDLRIECLLASLNCFTACANDCSLSLMLAYQLEYQLPLVSTLTGILLGAYNGKYGFCASDRLAVKKGEYLEILQLNRFFAAWCGVNRPDNCDCWDSIVIL
jgi:hypothetical protein